MNKGHGEVYPCCSLLRQVQVASAVRLPRKSRKCKREPHKSNRLLPRTSRLWRSTLGSSKSPSAWRDSRQSASISRSALGPTASLRSNHWTPPSAPPEHE